MSLDASARYEAPALGPLRYLDVILILAAAPVLLLIGVPVLGYLVGAGAWTGLRALGVLVDRRAALSTEPAREITIRLFYVIGRVLVLALAIVLVRRGAGKHEGLTTLLVIVFAFTVAMCLSIATRPRPR